MRGWSSVSQAGSNRYETVTDCAAQRLSIGGETNETSVVRRFSELSELMVRCLFVYGNHHGLRVMPGGRFGGW